MNRDSDEMSEKLYTKEGSINYFNFFSLLWRSKLKITLITFFFLILSILYALYLPSIYSSSATVKLTDGKEETSQLSQMASKYSGLAGVAGISLQGGNSGGFYVVEKIKSLDFLNHLLTFENVEAELIHQREINPSPLEIYDIYSESLSIYISKDTNFINISFLHPDPSFAQSFIRLMVSEINDISRRKDLKEAEDSLIYLKKQLTLTQQTSIKQSINILIEKELKTTMLGNIRKNYVVEYINTPFLPEKRFSPKRSLICIIGIMVGLLSSLFFVIIQHIVRQKKI